MCLNELCACLQHFIEAHFACKDRPVHMRAAPHQQKHNIAAVMEEDAQLKYKNTLQVKLCIENVTEIKVCFISETLESPELYY